MSMISSPNSNATRDASPFCARTESANWTAANTTALPIRAAISIIFLGTAIVLVGYQYGAADVLRNLQQLSIPVIVWAAAGLLANAVFAAIRFQTIAAASGIPLVIHWTALWLLAELGLLGFAAFAVPGIYVWLTEWRRAPRDPAAAVVALCFVGFAVMSGPADMLYQRTFWLLAGAALAVLAEPGSPQAFRHARHWEHPNGAADENRGEAAMPRAMAPD